MKTREKSEIPGREKTALRGVTAEGVLSGSNGRGCKGDSWN